MTRTYLVPNHRHSLLLRLLYQLRTATPPDLRHQHRLHEPLARPLLLQAGSLERLLCGRVRIYLCSLLMVLTDTHLVSGPLMSTKSYFMVRHRWFLFYFWVRALTYCLVRALYDYQATIDEEFDFQAGDVIAVTSAPEDGWWSGELLDDARKVEGKHIFPSNFVCLF